MAPKKIIPTKLPKHTSIKPGPTADNETLRFSFKHLDTTHEKFLIQGRDCLYFTKVFERLKNLSSFKVSEIFSNRSSSLRAHPIDWETSSEKDGFARLNEQLKQIPAYQFQISANEHGRVHGFILDNIFFVIWFDPVHNLYPKKS